ncbi:hypothetical protein [Tsukamurella sp. NPDC003166]|uniref:hypothetical protein n=1 Tax=Tsukamurella sp. NPDC003166 TaxID=3154444 RepID=UPI0033B50803
MARAFRRDWTPDEDSRLREIHAQGHSYRGTADILDADHGIDVTHQQVAHRCKQLGLLPNLVRRDTANDERRERILAFREQLAEELLADALHMRERIWDEYEVIVPGMDGPRTVTLDIPDAKAAESFVGAVDKLIGAVAKIENLGGNRTADTAKSMIAKLQRGIESIDFEETE